MLKTYLYVPEELEKKIILTAKAQKKSKAEILRQALNEGLNVLENQKIGGAEILLKLAQLAKKSNSKGPRDASINHDYYLWGLPKKNIRIKP